MTDMTDMKNLTVMIVDDDEFMLIATTASLNSLGIEDVVTAVNGVEALTQLKLRQFDLMICDLNMPEMDGIELIRRVAQTRYSGSIMLVSGEDKRVIETVEMLAIGHNLDVAGIAKKPLTSDALKAAIGNMKTDSIGPKNNSNSGPPLSASDLHEALVNEQLTIFVQPKVSVETRRVTSVEALVRWIHPEWGMVGPDAFIPLAERHDLIDDLTALVFHQAVTHCAAWRNDEIDMKIAINISVDNLHQMDLPEIFNKQALDAGINPEHIILEITESRIMQDILAPLEVLTRFCLKGFQLSIDDFGTGYSTMEQLKRIPFKEMKIDRMFVNGASNNEVTLAILESSVALAKRMGMNLIAEGVEDEAEWDLMDSLNCDVVQGYYISKPMPADEFPDWLKEYDCRG